MGGCWIGAGAGGEKVLTLGPQGRPQGRRAESVLLGAQVQRPGGKNRLASTFSCICGKERWPQVSKVCLCPTQISWGDGDWKTKQLAEASG